MPLLSLAEARAQALALAEPLPPRELPLHDALGLFLSADVTAARALPGCDNSAMDGYAVRAAETKGATRDAPARLPVAGALYAGQAPGAPLPPGQAARIFTGAPVPEGADCVVRQEAAREENGQVLLFVETAPGENVRRRGEEISEGQRLFACGQRVDAWVVGVLASQGRATAWVRPRPRVAVLTVGDELLPPGAPALPHQIHDSNGPLLAALAREADASVLAHERLPDDDRQLRSALERWLPEVDLVITSGGASVGDRDRVKRVLAAMGGTLHVDGVALKPGKPAGLATVGGTPVAVLPGNPGAAAVAFDQLARPMLFARQGVVEERERLRVRLDGSRHKQAGLTYLLSARVQTTGEGLPWARIRPQGAGQIFQNVGAHGWAVLPQGRDSFVRGDEVEFERFEGSRFRPARP